MFCCCFYSRIYIERIFTALNSLEMLNNVWNFYRQLHISEAFASLEKDSKQKKLAVQMGLRLVKHCNHNFSCNLPLENVEFRFKRENKKG